MVRPLKVGYAGGMHVEDGDQRRGLGQLEGQLTADKDTHF